MSVTMKGTERCVFHIHIYVCVYIYIYIYKIYIYMKLKKQHLEMHKMKSTIPELSWEVATSMWLWEKKNAQ